MIKRVFSKGIDDWGFKADFYLGKGKNRRRVRLPPEGVFASELHARNEIAKARAAYARGQWLFNADLEAVTVQTIFDTWSEYQRKQQLSKGHMAMTARTFTIFGLRVLSLDSPFDELNREHLGEYFTLRKEKGKKHTTVFKELQQILSAIGYAVENVPGLENWKPPKKPDWIVPVESERERVISLEEEAKILEDLRDHGETLMWQFFIIGLDTGMRRDEIRRIDRADVSDTPDEEAPWGYVTAQATKATKFGLTGKTKPRPIPMTTRVREVLDALRANWDPLTSASMPSVGRLFPKFGYRAKLEASCKRVDVPYGLKTPNGIVFHDTRHSFVTALLRLGVSLATIAKLTGHKKLATTSDYAHATAADLGRAIKLLEASRQ